jgi:3-hydroxyisobutyrate dehydrogenase-like beta-hydroxyacid dehydrogenase
MKLGFIGLGQMGRYIAHNLLKSGEDLIVSDVKTDFFAEFEVKGATATTEMTVISSADVIFLCLPNSFVVQNVLFGNNGLVDLLKPGQTVVDLSTINYSTTIEIATALEKRGIAFVDAPISGMEARAKDGTLTVMCGGQLEVFDRIKPFFECIGNKILYTGTSGCGQLTKLINQLLFDINAAALAEILPMAVKLGLDPEDVVEVVNSGTGRSYASEFFLPRNLEGNFTEGYPMKAAYKDLVSAAEISANSYGNIPTGSAQGLWRPK